jgi:hypothetical protein
VWNTPHFRRRFARTAKSPSTALIQDAPAGLVAQFRVAFGVEDQEQIQLGWGLIVDQA